MLSFATAVSEGVTSNPLLLIAMALITGLLGVSGLSAIIKSSSDARTRRIELKLQGTEALDARLSRITDIQDRQITKLSGKLDELETEQQILKQDLQAVKNRYVYAVEYIRKLLQFFEEEFPEHVDRIPQPPDELKDVLNAE